MGSKVYIVDPEVNLSQEISWLSFRLYVRATCSDYVEGM